MNVKECLASNDKHDEAEEDPADKDRSVVAVRLTTDIGHGEQVEVCETSIASRVDWKEDDPSQESADKHNECDNLVEAEVEVAIDAL